MPQPDVDTPLSADETRRLLAYLGAGLVAGGVPVHEVTEDVRQTARLLGHARAQVNTTPTGLMLSLGDGSPATYESVEGSLRLDQLAEVNALQRALMRQAMSPRAVLERLAVLRRRPHRYSLPGMYAGGVVSAAGIAMILQPALGAVVFAALLNPVTIFLMTSSGRLRLLRTLLPLVAAFVIALAAVLAWQQGWVPAPLRTLLPPLAVLLPGALLVTGLSELAAGAMIAGSARVAFGTAQLLLFALGVLGATALLDAPASAFDTRPVDGLGWWAAPVGVVLITVGICLMEAVSWSLVPWVLAVLATTHACQALGTQWLDKPWLGAFLGAAAGSLGAAVLELLRPSISRAVVFLPSFWLLVPGSLGLLSLTQAEQHPNAALDTLLLSVGVVIAIALGIVVGTSVAHSLRVAVRRTGLRQALAARAARRRASGGRPDRPRGGAHAAGG